MRGGGVASVGVWREREGEREERQERESVGRARVSVALGGTVLGGRERHMDMYGGRRVPSRDELEALAFNSSHVIHASASSSRVQLSWKSSSSSKCLPSHPPTTIISPTYMYPPSIPTAHSATAQHLGTDGQAQAQR